jgi:hypothetical protein
MEGDAMAIDESTRKTKIELAELKEKISDFLYKQFIDFERDKGILINDVELHPSFFLNKYGIIIDCFRMAKPGNPDYDKAVKLYEEDGVKFMTMDVGNVLGKNINETLRAKLGGMGVDIR